MGEAGKRVMMQDEVCDNTVERGRKGGKEREEEGKGRNEDTDLEVVNALGGRLAPAQRCTRDILLAPPTVAPRGISEKCGAQFEKEEGRCCTVISLSLEQNHLKLMPSVNDSGKKG